MRLKEILTSITGPRGSLKQRSISATIWGIGGIGISRFLSLISNLIMTRILMPEAFGLMAMVITVMIMATMVSDIGIRQSITRDSRGEDLLFLRVAWTVQILRSIVIAMGVGIVGIVIGFLGPIFASTDSVYSDSRLPWLIVLSTIAILLSGLESPGIHVANRRLELRKITTIEIVSQVITIITMISLAQFMATVWVLLIGLLIGAAQRTIWTHAAFRDIPMRVTWDHNISSDLWIFGRWLIVSSFSNFIVNQGDKFLLASFLDAEDFGIYVIATLWLHPPQLILNHLSGNVFYSGISEKLRTDPGQIGSFIKQARWVVDPIILIAFIGVLTFGPILIEALYTTEYHYATVFLMILSFRYLTRRQAILGSFLLSAGESRLMAQSTTLNAIFILVGVPIAYRVFGINSAVMMVALAPLGGSGLLIYNVKTRMPLFDIRSDVVWILLVIIFATLFLTFGIVSQ